MARRAWEKDKRMRMNLKPIKGITRVQGGREHGFTLIETMVAVVLLLVGLLGLLEVFPRGLRLGVQGNDQGKASALNLQRIEFYKNQSSTALVSRVGDYGAIGRPVDAGPEYFDANGATTTQAIAYYTRDVQVQYWTWNGTQFVKPTNPYTAPGSGVPYVFRMAVATHWLVRAQTAGAAGSPPPRIDVYTPGGTGTPPPPSGCVVNNTSVPMGSGCIEVSTFTAP